MLEDFIRALWRINNYDRIPKLPRGMLASEYKTISRDEARVLARMGARCPAGVKVAMKRAGFQTAPDLARELQHYRPTHRLRERLNLMVSHFFGSQPVPPHRTEILTAQRRAYRQKVDADAVARIKTMIKTFQ